VVRVLVKSNPIRSTYTPTKNVDASTYAIDEKRFAVILRLHTSAFDHATTMTLLKELMRLVAGRIDSDDRGEGW
jgi:hypothetical protein